MIEHGLSTHGTLIVNGTDDEAAYRAIPLPAKWTIEVLPQNIGVCGAMRKAFRDYPTEDSYTLCCDDEFPRTHGFDANLIEAAGQWGISHGNDEQNTDAGWIHTFSTWGGSIVREVGWWPLPKVWHCFGVDNTWQIIAKEFGLRRYCRDVLTTHLNTWHGTAPMDATYEAGRIPSSQDEVIFQSWIKNDWPYLRDRLRTALR